MSCRLSILSVTLLLAFALGTANEARAEHTRATNPLALTVEGLGRGLMWSANFDMAFGDDFAAGAGIGTVGLNITGTSIPSGTATLIPIYAMYYFARSETSLFLTAGADIVAGSVNGNSSNLAGVNFGSSPVLATFGLGVESRRDSGVLFRAAGYGIYGTSFSPWGGISLGYSF